MKLVQPTETSQEDEKSVNDVTGISTTLDYAPFLENVKTNSRLSNLQHIEKRQLDTKYGTESINVNATPIQRSISTATGGGRTTQ